MIDTKGQVVDIIYRNEENFYSVFKIETEDGDITVVGKILELNIGDLLSVSGKLVFHDEYGEQIKLNTYEKIMPSSVSEIERYLSSGIISNIKEKRAKQIVKKFGEDTIRILMEEPERLLDINGIGKKSVEKIHRDILVSNESREVSIYLQKFNLGNKLTSQIYAKYKKQTIDIIENNPYRLVDDIKGIGFPTADKIAQSIGIKPDSEFRIRSAIVYILNVSANRDGNCYLKYETFINYSVKVLNLNREIIENTVPNLVLENLIKIINYKGENIVYSRIIYDLENSIAQKLIYLLEYENSLVDIEIDKEIDYVEEQEKIRYSDTQRKAIKTAISEKIMIITGGPGTGKTTIIKAIISIVNNLRLKYTLCAPTGRAAKRMEESTGSEASTIHRLLGYKSIEEEMMLDFNEENPLDSDFIVVDEVSMVDVFLMNNLLKAVKESAVLIFVGDKDQLPSVGAGNVLNDMIESNVLPTIKLDVIFRQGEGSNIVKNAHLINAGQRPILNEENKDFFFIKTKNDSETLDTIVDLISNRLPKHYGVDPINDIQVLTPTRKGICGVDSLNTAIQEKINPVEFNKSDIKNGNIIFRDGDKVMQTKNNYDLELKDKYLNIYKGVFNGDIGNIKSVFPRSKSIEVDYDKKIADYKSENINELTLAYSATIHKSQGSEFPIVIIPMAQAPYMLLTRNILYTGITRGKSLVVLVGNLDIMNRMIDNVNFGQRNSSLDYYLSEGKKKYDQKFD